MDAEEGSIEAPANMDSPQPGPPNPRADGSDEIDDKVCVNI